ncbi:MAG: hypothetical protein QN174_05045 [Armatimonadota bacterium]|nr:hypothetical protein [Armatimonadota bacterium]MDR7422266.1 hypothetical protein [Armatimonadota bacterium]MDR7456311.1 hypothetical protein [Armatimonadota bacterium]MDR7496308.1 hypothetical protein [Armatimonadota bacterium]MDR7512458.1 hypothetical protein [Armatimonadota bacterium]
MAAEPVSERELAALHARLGRDLAELRARWRRWGGCVRRSPDEVVGTAVDLARALRALQSLASSVRIR